MEPWFPVWDVRCIVWPIIWAWHAPYCKTTAIWILYQYCVKASQDSNIKALLHSYHSASFVMLFCAIKSEIPIAVFFWNSLLLLCFELVEVVPNFSFCFWVKSWFCKIRVSTSSLVSFFSSYFHSCNRWDLMVFSVSVLSHNSVVSVEDWLWDRSW